VDLSYSQLLVALLTLFATLGGVGIAARKQGWSATGNALILGGFAGFCGTLVEGWLHFGPPFYPKGVALTSVGLAFLAWHWTILLRQPDWRFRGAANASVEPPSVQAPRQPERPIEEVLEYLPRGHKGYLYWILDGGRRELEYSQELSLLWRHGLVEQVLKVAPGRGVFRIPESVQDPVAAHRQQEIREGIRRELRDAEARPSTRDFLSLYTADEMPSSVPLSTYRAAETLRYSSLVTREYDAEGQRFTYTLTEDARGALEGGLFGRPIKRICVELAVAMIEGYDPAAPDYSGRGLPMRPDEDD
jgi:hypothetical protein